jgi:hypothetical protein
MTPLLAAGVRPAAGDQEVFRRLGFMSKSGSSHGGNMTQVYEYASRFVFFGFWKEHGRKEDYG